MAQSRHQFTPDHGRALALILIDYDNLAGTLPVALGETDQTILPIVANLRRYLKDGLGVEPTHAIAFGDFSDSGAVDRLASIGVETRHVPPGAQALDPTIALTIEATERTFDRPEYGAFVLLSGNNWYLPLIASLKRRGKQVLVAAIDTPNATVELWSEISDAFFNARVLLPTAENGEGQADVSVLESKHTPEEISAVDDSGAMQALELIDEFFGQYEEVYLTPLLRRMTEILYTEDGEPKDLVNTLRDAGAVWLEKRQGFPHDYTVLKVNEKHPDVISVRARSESEGVTPVDSELGMNPI